MGFCFRGLAAVLLTAFALSGARAEAQQNAMLGVITLFDQQEYREARRQMETLSEAERNTAEALYYSGRLDLIEGDRKAAEKHFERAIDADPGLSDYHYWLAVATIRAIPYAGFLGKMTGSMKALKELKKAVELDSTNLRPKMTLYQMLTRSYDRGAASRKDLLEQAESIAAVDSIMGMVALGTLHKFVDKDLERAGAVFRQAHDLAPANRASAISYADYLWEAGARDGAIQVLTEFVEKVPEDKTARFNLATRTIRGSTDYAGARRLLEECLTLKSDTGVPTEAMVRWSLGLACHLMGDDQRAQVEWSTVDRLDPDFDNILENDPEMSELQKLR